MTKGQLQLFRLGGRIIRDQVAYDARRGLRNYRRALRAGDPLALALNAVREVFQPDAPKMPKAVRRRDPGKVTATPRRALPAKRKESESAGERVIEIRPVSVE